MDAAFWHDKWDSNQIGFHAAKVNRFLETHFGALGLTAGARVFVPLCGKTRDIGWLLEQGFHVVGAELSEAAIVALFDDLGMVPSVRDLGSVKHYSSGALDVFVGDIFEVSLAALGPVDAVYDRAALVALPLDVRIRYVAHVGEITQFAPQLLLTFSYDQSEMTGPPFSVTTQDVVAYFGAQFDVLQVGEAAVEGGFKGRIAASEAAWVMHPK